MNHFDPERLRVWLQAVLPGIAIGGAVFIAVWQQKKADDRAGADRRRRHLASRVTLPISLAKINRYAEECAAMLRKRYPFEGGSVYYAGQRELPAFPHDVIVNLKECIEAADGEIINDLAELIQFCQVQNSRMVGAFSRVEGGWFVSDRAHYDATYDALRLWSLVEKFYKYGRLESGKVDPNISHDDIEGASRILGFDAEPEFVEYLISVKNVRRP